MRVILAVLVVTALAVAVWNLARGAPSEPLRGPPTLLAAPSVAAPAPADQPFVGFDARDPQNSRARLDTASLPPVEVVVRATESPGGVTAIVNRAHLKPSGVLVQLPASWVGARLSPAPQLGLTEEVTVGYNATIRVHPVLSGDAVTSIRLNALMPSQATQFVIIQVTP